MTVEQLQGGTEELDPAELEPAQAAAPLMDSQRRVEILAGVPEIEPAIPSIEAVAEEPEATAAVAELAAVAEPVAVEEPVAVAEQAAVEEQVATGEPEAAAGEEHASGEVPQQSMDNLVAFELPAPSTVSPWPFVAYDAVWLVFAGLVTWQLLEIPSGIAVYDAEIYPLVLVAGLALTVTGPALVVASWFAARGHSEGGSGQLFVSALLRGAVATSIGVALWWTVLIAVDRVRLGSFF